MWRALLALTLAGCIQSSVVECADGTLCPAGLQCDPRGASCVTDDQVTQCMGRPDLTECTVGADAGVCRDGVCDRVGCGDGFVMPPEECEHGGTITCEAIGYDSGGTIGCGPHCLWDTTACTGICNDGHRDDDEQCDSDELAGLDDCQDLGFYDSSPLGCNSICHYDTDACTGFCGDLRVNGPEACDGAPPQVFACTTAGFDAGQLGCTAGCVDSREHCRNADLELVDPGVPGAALEDVWGSGRDFYAAGALGVLHSAGGAWSLDPTSPTLLRGIWGSALDDLFVVGEDIHHFDGTAWEAMPVPGTPQLLNAVWGRAANDVFAVGEAGTVLHYDGVAWASLTTPAPAGVALQDVWGTGAELFIVGDAGVILHWTGSAWQDQSVGTGTSLTSVWGRSATEVYAVTLGGVIWRYNGTAWTVVAVLNERLFAIGGIPGGGVVAVGAGLTTGRAVVVQQIGTQWVDVAPAFADFLVGAWGTESGLVAVGDFDIVHWSGATWLTLSPTHPTIPLVEGIWADDRDDVYVVGGDDGSNVPAIGYWNGSVWQVTGSGAYLLTAVWGTDASHVVAVGSGGHALHGSRTTFVAKPTGVTANLSGVWGSGTGFYAVGSSGTIIQFDGTSWSSEVSGTTQSLYAVWGTGTEVFAVGALGTIVHRSGTTWSTMASGTTVALNAVWGRGPTDVFAVGVAGTILHYDGATWRPMPSGVTDELVAVASSSGEVLATSGLHTVEYVGGRWLPLELVAGSFMPQVMTGNADFFAFATPGVVDVRLLAGRMFHPAPAETACDDLWDDDEDGLTDCADADCAGAAACVAPGACRPATRLACGDSTTGTTVDGATRYPYYGAGCTTKDESGREAYYLVSRATAGPIQVALSGFSVDLDLVVAGTSAEGACIPDEQCLAASQTGAATESASIDAAAGVDYVIVVDGSAGAIGPFTLEVTCD